MLKTRLVSVLQFVASKNYARVFSGRAVDKPSNDIRTTSKGLLKITNEAIGQIEVHPWWLRDHCRCTSCYNWSTWQRRVLLHKTECVKIQNIIIVDGELQVLWSDGHNSSYKLTWLQQYIHPGKATNVCQPRLWSGSNFANNALPSIPYSSYMSDENSLKQALTYLISLGFVIIEQTPETLSDTEKVAKRMSFIQETLYGKMWEFTSDLARSDTAYTSEALSAHNDFTYGSQSVGIQIFHCLKHTGSGGETLLVDGFNAAENLRLKDPAAFNLLATTEINHENCEGELNHLQTLSSILRMHPVTQQLIWIRYNPYDRSPINTISQDRIEDYYKAVAMLAAELETKENELWIKLTPGKVLLLDNWRVLHGRSGFTGHRHVCGCYLPYDGWRSRARVMNLID